MSHVTTTANAGMSRSVALKVTPSNHKKTEFHTALSLKIVHLMVNKIWQAKHTHKHHRKSCDIWPGRKREPNHL